MTVPRQARRTASPSGGMVSSHEQIRTVCGLSAISSLTFLFARDFAAFGHQGPAFAAARATTGLVWAPSAL
jgi:hypothetical protein